MLAWVGRTTTALLALALVGCAKMSDADCNRLRSEAFEILNGNHPCMQDSDCKLSRWPGCPKGANADHDARVGALADKFEAGQCKEPVASCPDATSVFCQRNLCVMRRHPEP